MPILAQFCTLPNDVLRVMADFTPPSGLLLFVQCNRQLQSVLRRQLSRRLDDLFTLSTRRTLHNVGLGFPLSFKLPISDDDLKCKMEEVFGMGNMWSNNNFVFIETSKGYDGSSQLELSRSLYVQDSWGGHNLYRVISPNFSPHRFVGWLHRRHDQLSAKEEAPL
jgi:hypothetical protein